MARSTELVLRYDGNDVKVSAHDGGAMSFSADASEHFIYLYPHQVALLKAFLADLNDPEPITQEQFENLNKRST